MAITRSQQYRQMLKEGSKKPVVQGGVDNYLGNQPEVQAPRKWQSSPDKPATELAYITEAEKDLIIKENIHGGLEDGPNMGPSGIISLDSFGDAGGGGQSGADYDADPGGAGSFTGATTGGGGSENRGSNSGSNYIVPPKKPKKTEDNRLIDRFVPPSAAILGGLGEGIANSRLGRFLNTKQREKYLEYLEETNPSTYNEVLGDLEAMGYVNKDVELYGPEGKGAGRDVVTFEDLGEPQAKAILGEGYTDYLNRNKQPTGNDNSDNQDPCKGPNPPAYCFVGIRSAEVAATPVEEKSPFEILNLRTRFADGGMPENPAVEGGIMDIESGRQMYFLGKLVKKATRAVKKIVKSPIGKAALIGGLGLGFSKMGGLAGLKGALFGTAGGVANMTPGFLGKLGLTGGGGSMGLTGFGKIVGGGLLTASPYLFGDDDDTNKDQPLYAGPDIEDPRIIMANYPKYLNLRNRFAEGGEAEPVAKKTMPLLDMDGKEMDLREEGGFVPLGRMERADDVPARLSKNEFVFTADAVRNAGEGDIDKGAEVMYNMMKNLESGGEVSEESQGLDGARDMFQTSQRLEEVL